MALPNLASVAVELKGVHLCCMGCVNALTAAVETVPGAACRCDMDSGAVTLTAPDEAAAQRALDAIAAAGFYGDTGDSPLAIQFPADLPAGMVQRLVVSGIHNCCRPCYDAIEGAIRSVAGVTGDTAAPRMTTFQVTGNFSASELVQALHAAGFHAQVK
jgi:copper chaperone CopZ